MLTQEDIAKLIEAERAVFPTKVDFDLLRKDFSDAQSSVDAFAKRADTYYQETMVLVNKIQRMEEWIRRVATKVGIEYSV